MVAWWCTLRARLEPNGREGAPLGWGNMCEVCARLLLAASLHVTRWMEREMRLLRGEPRTPEMSLMDQMCRINEFILKLKGDSSHTLKKALPKQLPQGYKKSLSPEEFEAKLPVFATLEEALESAAKCTKCTPTQQGTKGCTFCMGKHPETGEHWFEHIRIKRAPKEWLQGISHSAAQKKKGEGA